MPASDIPDDLRDLHQRLSDLRGAAPLGGGNRLMGGPSRMIDMTSFCALGAYHPEDLVVTAGAGMRLSQLAKILDGHRQWLPLAAPDGADDTIGGAISAGLDGWYRGGYGPFRDRILGFSAVTPAFGPIFVGSQVVKSVAGYNLPRLFFGTRGALGVITEVTMKVSPRPAVEAIWCIPLSSDDPSPWVNELWELSGTWASLSLVRRSQERALYAVWHGPSPGLGPLISALGEPGTEGLPVLDCALGLLVAGAVPRSMTARLANRWPSGSFHMECQTGGYFGQVSTEDVQSLASWIQAAGGVMRVLRSSMENPLPRPPDSLWRHLKQQFDPDGSLFDPWRCAE